MLGWVTVSAMVTVLIVVVLLWIRSEKRWQPPPPTTPEAKQAEANLWSTRNMGQR